MIIGAESYAIILNDIKEIVPEFMKEVDIYPESPKPNLDHDQFIDLEEQNVLQVTTARLNEQLMGIHVAAVMPDIFYKHILTAYVLWYYIKPEGRGSGQGKKMFTFAEDQFKKKNVERVFMTRKIYMPNENLFKKLKFTHIESGYTKYIGKNNG